MQEINLQTKKFKLLSVFLPGKITDIFSAKSALLFLCSLFFMVVLFQVFSGPAAADNFSIRGGVDMGRLQMDLDMWDDTLAADLSPGYFVGFDYLILIDAIDVDDAGAREAGEQEDSSNNPGSLFLGAGGELSPGRSSEEGETFHLFNFSGVVEYKFSSFFTRTRLGFSWLYPPELQRADSLSLDAGPAAAVGGGFQIEETELEIFYAFNSVYISDEYINRTERLDIHRLGLALGFKF